MCLYLDQWTWVNTVNATPGRSSAAVAPGLDPARDTSKYPPVIIIAQASPPEKIPLCQGDLMISTAHKGHRIDVSGTMGQPKTKAGMRNQLR